MTSVGAALDGLPMKRPSDLFTAAYYGDLKRLKRLLHHSTEIDHDSEMEEEEDDEEGREAEVEPLDDFGGRYGNADGSDNSDDDGGEEEEEEREQERERRHMERTAKREKREQQIRACLAATGVLRTRLSAVNVATFGLFVNLMEQPDGSLRRRFVPSELSSFTAAPLHWAVLGGEDRVVEYLVEQGADVEQSTPDFPNQSARSLCVANGLRQTLRVLETANQRRLARDMEAKRKEAGRLTQLDQRREKRIQRRAEKELRKLKREQLQDEEEEEEAQSANHSNDKEQDGGFDDADDEDES